MIKRSFARVPISIRREWKVADVMKWWNAAREFMEFRDHSDTTLTTVLWYCHGLYGEGAVSDSH